MSNRRKTGAQAMPLKGRKFPAANVPRKVAALSSQSVTGVRRDFLRYVDFHPGLYLLTGVAIIALVCVIYLGQVTAVANANYTLQALQSDHTSLMREKENLQLEIARSQSLPNIEKIAKGKLQMVPIGDNYEYLPIAPGPIQSMPPADPPATGDNAGGAQPNP
jgi:hypothetical protein